MGKTVDQLNLGDEILRRALPVDVRDTEWYRFAEEIAEILATGQFEWAEQTLSSIKTSVEQFQSVTGGQRRAVANITAARTDRPSRAGSRRYEGFRERGRS